MKETTWDEFERPRIATMTCADTHGGVRSMRGRGMNRVGRDRNCHAFTGRLHEVLVYTRALTEDEVLAVENYLGGEWPFLSA